MTHGRHIILDTTGWSDSSLTKLVITSLSNSFLHRCNRLNHDDWMMYRTIIDKWFQHDLISLITILTFCRYLFHYDMYSNISTVKSKSIWQRSISQKNSLIWKILILLNICIESVITISIYVFLKIKIYRIKLLKFNY